MDGGLWKACVGDCDFSAPHAVVQPDDAGVDRVAVAEALDEDVLRLAEPVDPSGRLHMWRQTQTSKGAPDGLADLVFFSRSFSDLLSPLHTCTSIDGSRHGSIR
eukprot:4913916-Pleurochrysis_carterae.AAC.1